MRLYVEPIWPWWLLVLAVAAMIGALIVAYPRRIRHLPPGTQRLLIGLRVLVLLLILVLMLRPVFIVKQSDDSDSLFYILTDASRSMQTADEAGGTSRRAALLKTLEQAQSALDDLGRKVELRYRDFSESIQTVAQPGTAAEGTFTAHGAVLEAVAEEAGRARVSGIVLLGDGKQAATGQLDTDPLQAARLMGRQQRPVYSVVYGGLDAGDTSLDLALSELDLSRDVFRGNVLPIRVRLKTAGAQGRPVRIRVYLEDRTKAQPGESGELRLVDADQQNHSVILHRSKTAAEEIDLQLDIVPDQVGDLKLMVEAEPLQGEVRTTNNRVETIVRVRQGGIRVAYIDIVRPEQKWLRQTNTSGRIQLDFHWIRSGRFLKRSVIPDQFFEPGNYDAFILGDVPAAAFRSGQLAALRRCLDLGAGLMMIGGLNTFGAGGYERTPIAQLIPVELSDRGDEQLTGPQKMLPTRDGLGSYVMQIASPEQVSERWSRLPPLVGANLLRRRNASLAQVLAASESGTPLLIGQQVGLSRVLAFAGDTTWQWAMHGFAEEHQRFWRQVIFWLTKKEMDNEQAVWVNAEPRDVSPGDQVELAMGARDDAGAPLTDVDLVATVTTPSGEEKSLSPRRDNDRFIADFRDTTESGDYWVRVRASRNGESLGPLAITRFNVNSRDPELDSPAADPSMMREIAHLSGGDFLTADELISRLEQWAEQGLPGANLERTERTTLWDNWIVLLALVTLLTAEWAIRKKRGLV
jgi:uncharacterized membrane protein